MKFHPDEIEFEHDVEVTLRVSALVSPGQPQSHWHPGADATVSIQAKVFGKWFDLSVLAEHLPEHVVEEIEQIAFEMHADAEYERKQHQLFGPRYAEPM